MDESQTEKSQSVSDRELMQRITSSDRPVLLDVWAPWCVPCRQMAPHVEVLSEQYEDSVQTIKVNADEHPELITSWKVYTIPTVLLMNGGAERSRRSGAQSRSDLEEMYIAARDGKVVSGLSNRARFLRIGIAVAITMMSREFTLQWPFYLASGLVFFSAIHDRCPLWQAVKRLVIKPAAPTA